MTYVKTYTDKVYELLLSFEGEIILNDKVAPENQKQFIEIVTELKE